MQQGPLPTRAEAAQGHKARGLRHECSAELSRMPSLHRYHYIVNQKAWQFLVCSGCMRCARLLLRYLQHDLLRACESLPSMKHCDAHGNSQDVFKMEIYNDGPFYTSYYIYEVCTGRTFIQFSHVGIHMAVECLPRERFDSQFFGLEAAARILRGSSSCSLRSSGVRSVACSPVFAPSIIPESHVLPTVFLSLLSTMSQVLA